MNILKDNKSLLYKLYVEEERSLSDIAKDYSISSMTVRAWLKRVGIKTRKSTVNLYHELKQTPFSESQKYLIVGSVLGDGSLVKGKDCKNARFKESHCEKQLKYLQWKNNSLKPFVTSKLSKKCGKIHVISGYSCNTQDSYVLTTITHPYLTELYYYFYKDGIKIIPKDLYSKLNLLSIAIWICDDGCFTYDSSRGIYRLDLHTESFSYKENVFLCREILGNFFDMPFRINSRRYTSGKAYYICLSGKNKLKYMVKQLRPFIPDCMLYKFKKYL